MTSYHDLEESTYKSVLAENITRVHGVPTWGHKQRMVSELTKIAMRYKVSYGWSGGYGLIALIIGAVRLAADHPGVDPFLHPDRPDMAPTIAPGTSQHETRRLLDENNLARRDYAVVSGFCRGASELIRNALDTEYYEDLEHVRYGYDRIRPREYIEHLEAEHCPLDERATKQAREHYFRGWERTKSPRPEGLLRFGKRLDEEQESLGLDGVTISNANKEEHYLLQVFQSGVFPATTIREWKRRPGANQTHAHAKTFFQAEQKGLTEVHRLIGDTAQGHGYESAPAALERGLDTILDRFNDNVEQRVQETVDAGIQQLAAARRPTDEANAATDQSISQLREQLTTLASSMSALQREMATLTAIVQKDSGQRATVKPPPAAKGGDGPGGLKWKAGMKLNPTWSQKQRYWWSDKCKKEEPARFKEHMKEVYRKKLAELE